MKSFVKFFKGQLTLKLSRCFFSISQSSILCILIFVLILESSIFNLTSVYAASSSWTQNTDGVFSYGSASNVTVSSGVKLTSAPAVSNQLSGTSINDIYYYDTTKDTNYNDGSANDPLVWRFDATKSWYTETIDHSYSACVIASDDRCGTQEFPEKSYIVSTDTNLYIFDAETNVMWMRFDQNDSGYLLGSNTNNNTYHLWVLNGEIYIGMIGTSPEGLFTINFITDSAKKYNTTNDYVSDKNIGNRNSIVSWSTGPGPELSGSNYIYGVHAQVVNGKTYVVAGGSGGTETGTKINLLNETDQTIVYGTAGNNSHNVRHVWITSNGNLYYSCYAAGVAGFSVKYTLPTSNWSTAYCQGSPTAASASYLVESNWFPNSTSLFLYSSFTKGQTTSDTSYSFYVTEGTSTVDGTSNTIYFGNSAGLSVIQEKQGDEAHGTVKYYTKDFISEEMIGKNFQGMWPFYGSGSISNNANISDTTDISTTMVTSNTNGTGMTYATGVRGNGISLDGVDDYLKEKTYDTQQGALTYNPAANSFQDASQNMDDWDRGAAPSSNYRAYYTIVITNADSSITWGYLGNKFTTTNTNDSVYIYKTRTGTAGWNGVDPATGCGGGACTPSTYEIRSGFYINGAVTVGAWIKATDATNFIIAEKLTGNYGFKLNLDSSDYVNFSVGDGTDSQSATGNSAVTQDIWHHIVGTSDGNNIKVYLDGALIATQAQSNPGDLHNVLRIGYDGTNYANGTIDEPFATTEALTDAQIEDMWTGGCRAMGGTANTGTHTCDNIGSHPTNTLAGTTSTVKAVWADSDTHNLYVGTNGSSANDGILSIINDQNDGLTTSYSTSTTPSIVDNDVQVIGVDPGDTTILVGTTDNGFSTIYPGYPGIGALSSCSSASCSTIGFDTGSTITRYGNLTLTTTTPANTGIDFYLRTADNAAMTSNVTAWKKTASGADASSDLDNHRYVQYKAVLTTSAQASTPTLSGVTLAYDPAPIAPTGLTSGSITSSSITWSWTDNSGNEDGFKVYDGDGNLKQTLGAGVTSWIESSLSPNTSYTRYVVSHKDSSNSDSSGNTSALTLSSAPISSNITSSTATSTWTNNSLFTFTNSVGFGEGGVEYFRYAWDTSSTHTWTGSETQWTSSTLTQTATSDNNSWYLHLKGYNSEDTENETLDLGPFYYDHTVPTSVELISPGDNSYTNNERPSFKWKTTSDTTSGLSKYVLEIDNPSIGSGQPSGDFTINDISTSGTTDVASNKYTIRFEGFSDSDSTNDYISVYTKSSSDWGTSENDGKLREGKVTWKVKAVDSAGNESSSSRSLFIDRTSPSVEVTQINDVSFSSKNYSTTDQTPIIYGRITDSLVGEDSGQSQNDNGPKVASGPKSVEIKIEKKNGLGFYEMQTLATVNLNETYWTNDNSKIADNTKNKSGKYSTFEFTPATELPLGEYKITLTAKDNADNPSAGSGQASFTLNITTLAQITTPEEKEVIEQELKTTRGEKPLTPEQKEQIKKEIEITKPKEQSFLQKTGEQIGNATNVILNSIQDLYTSKITPAVTAIGNGIEHGLKFTLDTTSNINNSTEQTLTVVYKGIQTVVSETSQGLTTTQGMIGWQIGKVGSAIGQGYNRIASSTPQVTKNILTGIGQGVSETTSTITNLANTVSVANSEIAQDTTNAMGAIVNDTSTQVANITSNTVKATANGIANIAFGIGEKTEDISQGVGTMIIKFGYLFVPEPTRITNAKVIKSTPTTMTIAWETNHPANGKVNYGLTADYGEDVQSEKRTFHHEFTITGLQHNTTYYYEVMSQNRNYVYDANHTFTTPKK